jgi:hypothetical protein
MTPFEIRLELLKMAKEMLEQDYHAQREKIISEWQIKVEASKINGGTIPEHPSFPPFPSENEIITKAQALNTFVSNLPTTEVKSKKSA